MRKSRNAIAQGLYGQSSWEHKYFIVDFSHDIEAGALTVLKSGLILPIPNTSLQMRGPQDDFGALLTAAVGNRVIGSGKVPIAVLTGAFLAHYTPGSPMVVYQPAGTTFQVIVRSAAGVVGSNPDNLTAAFNAAAATNFVDPIAITAPANRQVSPDGQAVLTTAANLFPGDVLDVAMVTTGALTPTGSVLAMVLQLD